MSRLTDAQRAAYLASNGTKCPHCGGTDLDGKGVQIDSGTASQEIMCTDCGEGWFDIYTLTHVDPA